MMQLLITGAWKFSSEDIYKIEKLGHNILYLADEKDELSESVKDVDAIICNGLFLYHPIECFKKLRYLQLTSSGLDRVPIDYIKEKLITIKNANSVYSIPIAESIICNVLSLFRSSRFFYENQKLHFWEKCRNLKEIFGKTICVVGCGSVGTECAKRFKAFGCKVLGVDKHPYDSEHYDIISDLSCLDSDLSSADVVILTLPLAIDTYGLFNDSKFKLMRQDSIFVNVSRGEIVDENALSYWLDCKLLGAVIDVFVTEPLSPSSALWDKKNIIITPHNSFVSDNNNLRLSELIIKNLQKLDL